MGVGGRKGSNQRQPTFVRIGTPPAVVACEAIKLVKAIKLVINITVLSFTPGFNRVIEWSLLSNRFNGLGFSLGAGKPLKRLVEICRCGHPVETGCD